MVSAWPGQCPQPGEDVDEQRAPPAGAAQVQDDAAGGDGEASGDGEQPQP
jgi:hypothetical protein